MMLATQLGRVRLIVIQRFFDRMCERGEKRFRSDLASRLEESAYTERAMASYADFCSGKGKEMILPR